MYRLRQEIMEEIKAGYETDPVIGMSLYLFQKSPPSPLEFLRAKPSERWVLQGLLEVLVEEMKNVN